MKWSNVSENAVFLLTDKCVSNIDKDILMSCVYINPSCSTRYNNRNTKCGMTLFNNSLIEVIPMLDTDKHVLIGGDW